MLRAAHRTVLPLARRHIATCTSQAGSRFAASAAVILMAAATVPALAVSHQNDKDEPDRLDRWRDRWREGKTAWHRQVLQICCDCLLHKHVPDVSLSSDDLASANVTRPINMFSVALSSSMPIPRNVSHHVQAPGECCSRATLRDTDRWQARKGRPHAGECTACWQH